MEFNVKIFYLGFFKYKKIYTRQKANLDNFRYFDYCFYNSNGNVFYSIKRCFNPYMVNI